MRSTCKGSNNDDAFVVMYSKTKADTSFTAKDTNFYNLGGSGKHFLYVINTKAKININNSVFQNESGTFLDASGNGNGWGTQKENGAEVEFNLVNQKIESDLVVDSISHLTINMDINLDNSSFIELTGNSYYTSLNNDDKTGRIFTKITMNLENMTKIKLKKMGLWLWKLINKKYSPLNKLNQV